MKNNQYRKTQNQLNRFNKKWAHSIIKFRQKYYNTRHNKN